MVKKKSTTLELRVLKQNAAGIDIGATEIYVGLPPGRADETVRSFGAFTRDLISIADWLQEHGITTVAMESTGVYWIPLFQILEARGIEVFLVNARHVKAVPGRKTDVQDCQWLQYLHSVGLLQASFRPQKDIVAIRSLVRHRDGLTKSASRFILQMQKSLTQMNIQLHNVISDITGLTGLRIIDAIVSGEYNPKELAKLKHKRIHASAQTIAKSLEGDYRQEHIFTLKQSLNAFRFIQQQIDECDAEIYRLIQEFNGTEPAEALNQAPIGLTETSRENFVRAEMQRAFGINLFDIPGFGTGTILSVFSEVGPDFSKFRSESAFASWLTVCPNREKTGGKVIRSKTRRSKSRAAAALRAAAYSLANEKGYYGELYRRLRARFGGPKAVTAMAHRLARLLYHLVTTNQEFDQTKFAAVEARYLQRQEAALHRKAKALGYALIPVPETAPV